MRLKTNVEIQTIEQMMPGNNGDTILRYKISYPVFRSDVFFSATKMMSDYYRNRAQTLERFCRTALFHMTTDHRESLSLCEEVTISYCEDVYISLYFDRCISRNDAQDQTERAADTWELTMGGRRLSVQDLFFGRDDAGEIVLREIKSQISKQKQTGKVFYEPIQRCVADSFCERQFYMTKEGLSVFFQPYDILPPMEGIPVFLLPYGDMGPKPPRHS